MVSVSCLRRVQSHIGAAESYLEYCRELMETADSAGALPKLMRRVNGGVPCYVLLTGSRGLCGTYNHDLMNYFLDLTSGVRTGSMIVCGRWGCEQIGDFSLRVLRAFPWEGGVPPVSLCEEIADFLRGEFLSQNVCEVNLVYQESLTVLERMPVCKKLLPIPEMEMKQNDLICDFEPDAAGVFDALAEKYLRSFLYTAMLSASEGEQSARMTAMTAAADNASELETELTGQLNRMRQSAVTTELLELLGGTTVPEDEK